MAPLEMPPALVSLGAVFITVFFPCLDSCPSSSVGCNYRDFNSSRFRNDKKLIKEIISWEKIKNKKAFYKTEYEPAGRHISIGLK